MNHAKIINNSDKVIDSRNVIARIAELQSEKDALETSKHDLKEWMDHAGHEFNALVALAEEASGYASDWKYGETLIHDDYFKEYAQNMAEDMGAIDANASWPLQYIDWDAASEALKADYTAVDYDGQTYWIR